VRETLPDTILELADDVIFVDVTPEVLRERLREGKIYRRNGSKPRLANFLPVENLAALRELTLRELMRARRQRRHAPPFGRIVLGVRARERDVALIERMARLATRLSIELPSFTSTRRARRPMRGDRGASEATRVARALWCRWRLRIPRRRWSPPQGIRHDRGRVAARQRRLFTPPSFANHLLRAGARELIALAPR